MSIPQFCKVLCFIWAMSSASAAQTPLVKPLFYGFDFGTSGVRCCLIDSVRNIVHEDSLTWSSMNVVPPKVDIAKSWEIALDQLLERTPEVHRKSIMRMCISGTSSSALIYDTEISAISRQPRMYDFNVLKHGAVGDYGGKAIEAIQKTCPKGSAANAPTSTLAKVLSWNAESRIKPSERLAHQADYLIHHITSVGSEGKNAVFISDWHNALKLGYSVHSLDYPKWMTDLLHEQGISSDFIPAVIEPGQFAGAVNPRLQSLGYSEHCQVVAGTTDSIAAFLASGADKPGQAVTSLGSTLVIKLLSENPVEDSDRGIYSHRLGNRWLVGGASNVGCAVLRQEGFSDEELKVLSKSIDPAVDSPLKYYPLTKAGERFPRNDPNQEPVLDPKPMTPPEGEDQPVVCRQRYLHGILQGVAEVEKEGYAALKDLGASAVTEILTAGGGSKNDTWTRLRARLLGVPTRKADNVDAAYGDALLAAKYYTGGSQKTSD